MSTAQRLQRIADLILRHLALHLKKEVNDPRLTNVTITRVVLSPDVKQAKIYFMVLDLSEIKAVMAALQKAKGYLRTLLAHSCALRYTPKLVFIYDDSMQSGQRIDALLREIALDSDVTSSSNHSSSDSDPSLPDSDSDSDFDSEHEQK